MTTAIHEPTATLNLKTIHPAGVDELVRGQAAVLIERLGTLVTEQSVTLDLAGVERIDAAGIAALVALYQNAHGAGHSFRLTNVPARVEQILAVVGLDRYLVSHNAVQNSHSGLREQRPAA
jgi:anti-anti-sigma factor